MPEQVSHLRRLCVFCGSSRGRRGEYATAAQELAAELARRRIELVYGGGNIGLMGVLADAALEHSVRVTGIIPSALAGKELAHQGIDTLRIVDSMHARKAMMAELSDGFIAMPGGIGTFEEFFEILTWRQLGLHAKPCGLLDVAGYYDELIALLDRSVSEGFLKPKHRSAVLVARTSAELLDRMQAWRPAPGAALLDQAET